MGRSNRELKSAHVTDVVPSELAVVNEKLIPTDGKAIRGNYLEDSNRSPGAPGEKTEDDQRKLPYLCYLLFRFLRF